jgi:hypothetical protein
MTEDQEIPISQYRDRDDARAGETRDQSRDSQSPHRRQQTGAVTQAGRASVHSTASNNKQLLDGRFDGRTDLRKMPLSDAEVIKRLQNSLPPDTYHFSVTFWNYEADCMLILLRAIYAARISQAGLATAGSELQQFEEENPFLKLAWSSFDEDFSEDDLRSLSVYKRRLLASLGLDDSHFHASFLTLLSHATMKKTLFNHPMFRLVHSVYTIAPGDTAWTRSEPCVNEIIEWNCKDGNSPLQACVEKHNEGTSPPPDGRPRIVQVTPPRFILVLYTPFEQYPRLPQKDFQRFELKVGRWISGGEAESSLYNPSFTKEGYSMIAAVSMAATPFSNLGPARIITCNSRHETICRTTRNNAFDHRMFDGFPSPEQALLVFAALPPPEKKIRCSNKTPWGSLPPPQQASRGI